MPFGVWVPGYSSWWEEVHLDIHLERTQRVLVFIKHPAKRLTLLSYSTRTKALCEMGMLVLNTTEEVNEAQIEIH